MNCQSCGVPLPEDALFCTSCGVSTAAARPTLPAWDSGNQVPAMPDDLFRDSPRTGADPDQTTVRPAVWAPGAPPWRPLPAGTPEADLLPSERMGQATFLPEPPPRKRGAGFVVLASLLTLVLVAGVVGVIVIVATTQAPRRPQQSEPPPPPVSAVSSSARPRPSTASPSSSASPSTSDSASPSESATDAFPPAGATLCTGSESLAVGANTSCEFAAKVAEAIPAGGSGTFQVTATSPVTGKEYTMSCTTTTYTVCTGGNNASVYVKGA